MSRTRTTVIAVAATAAVAMASAGLARADVIFVDGDNVSTGASGLETTLDFGSVCPSDSLTRNATVYLLHSQTQTNNWWEDGTTVSVTASAPSTSQLSVGSIASVTLPNPWTTLPVFVSTASTPNSYRTTTAPITLTVASNATAGAKTATIGFNATGLNNDPPNQNNLNLNRNDSLNLTWAVKTEAECAPPPPANTAPTTPGKPSGSAYTQGGFKLDWSGSTDGESDAFTYTLEGKDADDAAFAVIASGLSASEYTFASGQPAEGTWTYRVKAVETSTSPALSSAYSPVSDSVIVDRTKPNPPSVAADRPAEYNDGTTDWWADTVTVTFTEDGDPSLPDSSDGSGVKTVTSPVTVSAAGAFTESGTATDNADNVSDASTLSGSIDTDLPVVDLVCPTEVILGSAATAEWTATDGGSGVAGDSSGSVTLDTTTIGSKTATAPAGAAVDNVGHESEASTCNYAVIYNFTGFFQPIDMGGVWNRVKAGSAVPAKFSLGGNQGLNILAPSTPNPSLTFTTCPNTTASVDEIEQTITAGGSSLTYDATSGQYVYVWKTDKAWAGKCGTFSMKLADNKTYSAKFQFAK